VPDDLEEPTLEFLSDSLRVVGRIGSTVVRRTGWWSPAVQHLLTWLEARGFEESVRFLGLDADGNEVLTYIEGTSNVDAWPLLATDDGLREYARLVRRYHDAVADYRPPEDARWMTEWHPLAEGEILTHGDLGPWNTVWRGDRAVGLLDWDMAGPRPVLHDIAYALEYSVPFRDDGESMEWLRTDEPPDRAHRMRVFADAYGLPSTEGLYDAVLREQETTTRYIVELGERGLQPHAQWLREGFVEAQERRMAWTRAHRHLFP
jgi:Ser/Thr protein kinase RdoA (MazF antagonist)